MKNIVAVLCLVLVSISVTAQSVLITPGAQSINGDSTNQDQLNVFGNGLLVSPRVKYTDEDPAGNVITMNCASNDTHYSLAGTLKDPSGDDDYIGGYDCTFIFGANDESFQAFELNFESFDMEADGDTVYVLGAYGETIRAYTGNELPESLIVSDPIIGIRIKTNVDLNVGTGFVLTWKAILEDGDATPIQNYTGEGMVYDGVTNAFWTGQHRTLDFENKGRYSTAMGVYTNSSGNFSTSIGYYNTASGRHAMALGKYTDASGENSMTFGIDTEASGESSTAMGSETIASGDYSIATGNSTTAIGESSTAMGYHTEAKGISSIAMGHYSEAFGDYSMAIGDSTFAVGGSSTAMGKSTFATGESSTSMGRFSVASGDYSTAMGDNTRARGNSSTVMGRSSEAIGDYSTAMGFASKATGNYSIAIGIRAKSSGLYSNALGARVSTNSFSGAMVLGDYVGFDEDSLSADAVNRFLARFDNGYKLYTNNDLSATSIGLMALHNANSWSSISDSTKKENFIASNGESVLKSVAKMRIGTWNYKGQNASKHRHWGVMAQDFHHHFGRDAYGTIGNDTTIATADFDGVSFAAIKALEERTRELQEELASEKRFSASLELTSEKLRMKTEQHEQRIEELQAQLQTQIQKNKAYESDLLLVRAESMLVLSESRALKEDFKELKEMLLKSVAVEGN